MLGPGFTNPLVAAESVDRIAFFHRWIEAFEASDDFLARKLAGESVATDGGASR